MLCLFFIDIIYFGTAKIQQSVKQRMLVKNAKSARELIAQVVHSAQDRLTFDYSIIILVNRKSFLSSMPPSKRVEGWNAITLMSITLFVRSFDFRLLMILITFESVNFYLISDFYWFKDII